MLFVSSDELIALLDYDVLVIALRKAFQSEYTVPQRHHHNYNNPFSNHQSTLLLMPAWEAGEYLGVKVVTVSPDNRKYELPAIQGIYLLLDANKGSMLAQMDGPTLTARRTAAASALAASYLANQNSSTLLMVGTGVLAPQLIQAHTSVLPIQQVYIWGRDFSKAQQLAAQLQANTFSVKAIEHIEEKAAAADVISCATLSKTPLLEGRWLRTGQHIDLVGSYLPDSREADDEVIRKSTIFADYRETATRESGDLFIPIQKGILTKESIKADLFELCKGEKKGRTNDSEITCFKSVGHALEDLAAAKLVYELKIKSKE